MAGLALVSQGRAKFCGEETIKFFILPRQAQASKTARSPTEVFEGLPKLAFQIAPTESWSARTAAADASVGCRYGLGCRERDGNHSCAV